jgi:hypothetical protein
VIGEERRVIETFHSLLILHQVRTQVSAWTGCLFAGNPVGGRIEELLGGLAGLAMAARCGGLGAFAQMCRDCCAWLVPPGDGRHVSGEALRLMGEWLASSERYLRDPTNPGAVADLVVRFTSISGEATDNLAMQSTLFRALLLTA